MNAEVIITNGVTIAEGRTVVVNCITATGSASTGELREYVRVEVVSTEVLYKTQM